MAPLGSSPNMHSSIVHVSSTETATATSASSSSSSSTTAVRGGSPHIIARKSLLPTAVHNDHHKQTLSARLADCRPGLGVRSNTVGVLKISSPPQNEDEDMNMKSSSSFTRESLLDRNASMPALGARPTRVQLRQSNLSLADAKKIWIREWRESQRQRDNEEYSISSFDDDLERSMRQYASLRSIDTLKSSKSSLGFPASEEQQQQLRVNFSTITIQEYPIIPGDHPGGSGGVPLTMDWESFDPVTIGLESYEKWRDPHRRTRGQLRIPRDRREKLLRSLGFSRQALQAAAKEATIIRKQRSKSNAAEHMDKTTEQVEATIRGLQNLLTLGKKKRKERAYLAKHVPSYQSSSSNNLGGGSSAAAAGGGGSSNSGRNRRASAPDTVITFPL